MIIDWRRGKSVPEDNLIYAPLAEGGDHSHDEEGEPADEEGSEEEPETEGDPSLAEGAARLAAAALNCQASTLRKQSY